jgi:hypothetical protein
MNQYIITKEIIAELIDYSNAEDAEACIRNIIKTKVYPYPYNPQQLGVELDTLAGKIIEHRWDFQVPDKHGRCPEVPGFEWLLDYIGNKVAEIGGHTLIKSEGGASYNPQAEHQQTLAEVVQKVRHLIREEGYDCGESERILTFLKEMK